MAEPTARLVLPDTLADALADIYADLLRRRAIRQAAPAGDAQQQPTPQANPAPEESTHAPA